jgi:hypothetical protein
MEIESKMITQSEINPDEVLVEASAKIDTYLAREFLPNDYCKYIAMCGLIQWLVETGRMRKEEVKCPKGNRMCNRVLVKEIPSLIPPGIDPLQFEITAKGAVDDFEMKLAFNLHKNRSDAWFR